MYDLNKIEKKNICIMGLMGSKCYWKRFKQIFNLNFYDTDKEIEIKTKKHKNNFEEDGEHILEILSENLFRIIKLQ